MKTKYIIAAGLGAVVHYTHAKIVEAVDREDALSQAHRYALEEEDFHGLRGGLSYDVFEVPANVENVYELGVANKIANGRLKPSAIGTLYLQEAEENSAATKLKP